LQQVLAAVELQLTAERLRQSIPARRVALQLRFLEFWVLPLLAESQQLAKSIPAVSAE
jgi:hypothetical protein